MSFCHSVIVHLLASTDFVNIHTPEEIFMGQCKYFFPQIPGDEGESDKNQERYIY